MTMIEERIEWLSHELDDKKGEFETLRKEVNSSLIVC